MKRSQYSPTINPWRLFMRPTFSNRLLWIPAPFGKGARRAASNVRYKEPVLSFSASNAQTENIRLFTRMYIYEKVVFKKIVGVGQWTRYGEVSSWDVSNKVVTLIVISLFENAWMFASLALRLSGFIPHEKIIKVTLFPGALKFRPSLEIEWN